ncbi:MAG: histidine phosphatase family protein [Alphaproteobacteria bacterium]|nr:histidine phosphatase family protein [Alphaproteobacteria bacterium]
MTLSVPAGITLYFARHGETEANVAGRFQGHTSDMPLTEKGIRQAEDLAVILGRAVREPAALHYVASPLHRAQRTMQLVRAGLALPIDGYATDGRLIEIDLGAWDGLTAKEAEAKFPEAYAARQANKWSVNVPGGGENYASVANRMSSFGNERTTDAFAVSHGAATRILRGLFMGLDWKGMNDLDEPQGVVFRVRGNVVERLDP